MLNIHSDDSRAVAAIRAIHDGDLEALKRLLAEYPELAAARLSGAGCGDSRETRSLLHVATDWPGHFPNGAATVAALVEAGADVDARFSGPHTETPLHWAASSDDVEVLDALIDAGAAIDAPGAVIGGGTPLDDAVAFGQWRAAQRLVERGAATKLWNEAALGLLERIEERFACDTPPGPDEITRAFWSACHGGQRGTAEYLLTHGAGINWVPGWERQTALDVARRAGAGDQVEWLRSQGARSAEELEI